VAAAQFWMIAASASTRFGLPKALARRRASLIFPGHGRLLGGYRSTVAPRSMRLAQASPRNAASLSRFICLFFSSACSSNDGKDARRPTEPVQAARSTTRKRVISRSRRAARRTRKRARYAEATMARPCPDARSHSSRASSSTSVVERIPVARIFRSMSKNEFA
jgi:hypothetical protein